MQNFIQFFNDYEKIVSIIEFIVFFVISIMLYRKTGNIKYLKEVVDDMRYRTPSYNVTETLDKKTGETTVQVQRATQSFDKLVPIYRLNKVTNELEKTDEFVDIQEQIESYKEMALQSMLDRFMPKLVDETADYTHVQNDLDYLTECFNVAEDYRERLNLSESASVQDVFAKMKEYSDRLKSDLENYQKGGKEVEKKETIEKSE